jgi:phospholipase C
MPGPRVGAVVCCLGSVLLIVLSGCGGGGSSSSLPTGSFQLSVQAMGGGGGTISSTPAGINCGQTCSASFPGGTQVTLTASPAANSSFAGWSGACSGTGACQVTLMQNTSVMANFSTSPVLTVALAGTGTGSVSSNPSGINCGQTCSAAFAAGTMVTLSATAGANSSFAGWTGGSCGSGSTCVVTLSASEKVTATFTATQGAPALSVIVAGTGKGTVTSSPPGINNCATTCKANFPAGTQVTLTATVGANSTFAGWTGANCNSSLTCVVTLSASETVTATFNIIQSEPVLTVIVQGSGTGTVTSSPAGINCPQTCNASFNTGTQVTLTATPATGSSFAGWGGACSGTSPTCVVTLSTSLSATANFNLGAPLLTVTLAGNSTGTVSSSPAGINCPQTCSANFAPGTQVTLTETPQNANFVGWGGACNGYASTCPVTMNENQQVSATFNAQNITALNHIIFLAQENRSVDHYFGMLRQYWAQNGYPDQSFDGLPQFNPTTGQPPLYGPPPVNPGCDPAFPPPDNCKIDSNSPNVTSYQLTTQCIENPGDDWDESHVDWNVFNPLSADATLNGMVAGAGRYARHVGFNDTGGIRAMGYYDSTVLNYYYFMATAFATSDRWFSPVMTRTPPNRQYMIAGTSQGHVHLLTKSEPPLTATTIFQELIAAGITWKIYVNPQGSSCTGRPYDPKCLLDLSVIQDFAWGQTIPKDYPQNIAPIAQYFTDLQNDTLPQVALIEPAGDAGYDEHPSNTDAAPNRIQSGANYVSSLINGLMGSSSWGDSVFILTYDEFGGPYDHVPPQPTVSPDGIKPVDLVPGDICYPPQQGPTCDFVYTGYRVPLTVVSPFTKKNYVSHTTADLTAILKLIETRFNVSSLSKRDAAQMDMTEFFDFTDPSWLPPPTPPSQATNAACYQDHLP